jgi:hypothetical protein
MDALLSALITFVPLILLGLFISLFWWWGGVRGNALGNLTAGLYFFASGELFIYVTRINVYARMDNAYLGNGILGLYLILFGWVLLFGSLAGFGIRWPFALLGGIATVFVTAFLQGIISSHYLLSSAIFVGVVLLVVFIRRRGWDAIIAAIMAAISVLIIWNIYGAGTMAFIPVDSVDAVSKYKPPVLDSPVFFWGLCLGIVLFVGGHFLQMVLPKPQPQVTAVSESPQL